ncbi:MAG: DNRLRE domain-containing protein, partial [Clostridia bacterium]
METTRIMAMILAIAMVFTLFAAFPMSAGAASMTDATFFAKLNYSAYPGLSAVKTAVDKGDYQTAKEELLKYFKERHNSGTIQGFGISEADEFYGMAVLPMRNILTGPYEFDMWEAEFTVTSSDFAQYEVDVTDRVASELGNGAVSFMLFAGNKQQYPVYVKSKEAGAEVAPKLQITYSLDGSENTVTVTADNDTYISSQNTSSTYGSETELVIKEDGYGSDSTGTNTRRTYINFPLAEAANSTIISAKLILNAAYASDCTTGDKDVLVINVGDTMWSENSITWAGTRGSIYSYQDAENPTWNASAPNCDGEYHNVTSRFWFGKPMAYEY